MVHGAKGHTEQDIMLLLEQHVLLVRVPKKFYLCAKPNICVQSKKRDIPIAHKCYKNWDGFSTSMESDIILEGFRTSVDRLGLIFDTIVSDGDSSSISKMINTDPYEVPIKKCFVSITHSEVLLKI